VQDLVHALAHDGLVRAAVGRFAHQLRRGSVLIYERTTFGPNTHIEPLLRAHLLHQQHLGDPELHAHMRDRLAVDEVLLQAHVAPNGLKGGGFYG
jgi:hypothetical protein